jgi:hypothetical protein
LFQLQHQKSEYSGTITPIYKEVQPKRPYSTEPIAPLTHINARDIFTDASKQVPDGLTAVDLGIPSTLNKQLTMMSTKYVKPSVYSKMSYTSKTVPPGYVGALMMNMAKQREMREQYSQPAIEQILSSDELKNRRNQISLDYNYFLKKTGDTAKIVNRANAVAETMLGVIGIKVWLFVS